jgi:hypothetical protein
LINLKRKSIAGGVLEFCRHKLSDNVIAFRMMLADKENEPSLFDTLSAQAF